MKLISSHDPLNRSKDQLYASNSHHNTYDDLKDISLMSQLKNLVAAEIDYMIFQETHEKNGEKKV